MASVETQETRDPEPGEQEFTAMDLLLAVARHKRLVLGLPIAAGIMSIIVSLLLPVWYTSTARLLPPQQYPSAAMMTAGQIGLASGGAALLRNPSDLYVAMLKSRTIADRIVQRFDLKTVYGVDTGASARSLLAANSAISAGRDGVIAIDVRDKDPDRAAQLANAYPEELRALTSTLAVNEAGQRRLFFEAQLKKVRDDLSGAEVDLRKFSQEAGLVAPQGQLSLSVSAAASLRAQIAAKEIQLSAMRTYATDANPETKRVVQELSGLRSELQKMVKDERPERGDVMVPFGKAPGLELEYLRRYRDVKYQETLLEILARQYENARIDEAKDAVLVQVLDQGVRPEKKSSPRRTLIVLLSVLGALVAGVCIAIGREYLSSLQSGAGQARFQELKSLLRWRARHP